MIKVSHIIDTVIVAHPQTDFTSSDQASVFFVNMAEHTIPIVLIGKTTEVGTAVTEALKPEYEGTTVKETAF